jgi:hypothetical protein
MSDMKEVQAAGVPIWVVSAKKPGHWIVRGIGTWHSPQKEVERYVGRVDPEIEWTQFKYFLPAYLFYGSGDIPAIAPQRGVYRFDYQGNDVYREDAVRLDG